MNYILMESLDKRFQSIDYVEGQVDKILSDLSDCLIGRVQSPDFLYIKSEKHSFEYAQNLLLDRLTNSGIGVRYYDGEDIPSGDRILVYDLDNAEWIKHRLDF